MTSENSEFLRMRGPSTGRRARRTPPLQLPQPRVAAIAVRDPSLTARDRLMQPRCQQLQNKGKTAAMAKSTTAAAAAEAKTTVKNSDTPPHLSSVPSSATGLHPPDQICNFIFFDEE